MHQFMLALTQINDVTCLSELTEQILNNSSVCVLGATHAKIFLCIQQPNLDHYCFLGKLHGKYYTYLLQPIIIKANRPIIELRAYKGATVCPWNMTSE